MKRRTPTLIIRAVTIALVMAWLAGMARCPMGRDPDHALLRLSWKTVGARVEVQRPLTPEEKERMPIHMQPRDGMLTTATILPYRLSLSVDGQTLLDTRVEPAGLHGDRPLSVEREYPLSPGTHSVAVAFVPEPTHGEEDNTDLVKAIEEAPHYVWEGSLELEAGQIQLITLGDESVFRLVP